MTETYRNPDLQVSEEPAFQALFSMKEAEKIFSVSRTQLYRLVSQGDIETVKIGRSRLISRGQIQTFVQRLENSRGINVIR
jgi:excisionase family DNA binding protein